MKTLVVLASHGGTILQSIIDASESGALDAQVALVISNNSRCQALERARKHGIATLHLSNKTHPDPVARDQRMHSAIDAVQPDWIVLAGYMKKLGGHTLTTFAERMINTHPSLLPKFGGAGFYGSKVHAAVLAAGESESGATIHRVDADYDSGEILAQVRVPVLASDTVEQLEERVKSAERALMVETLAAMPARGDLS